LAGVMKRVSQVLKIQADGAATAASWVGGGGGGDKRAGGMLCTYKQHVLWFKE
jgi:hypothetical protein